MARFKNGDLILEDEKGVVSGGKSIIPSNNIIINGDFGIWQRADGFSSVGSGVYTSDRWLYHKNGGMILAIGQSDHVPTVEESGHRSYRSLYLNPTTGSSMGSTDYCLFRQYIEGYNFQNLQGQTCTLSFWIKAYRTGIYCVNFQDSIATASYVTEYEIFESDTWEKKVITLDLDAGFGTWEYTTGVGIAVMFVVAAGSTYNTTADTWVAANKLVTGNQVNAVESTSDIIRLAQVKFEAGSVATPFVGRQYAEELALCQRYYEKSYNQGVAPQTATYLGMTTGVPVTTGRIMPRNVMYQVTKRATPTVKIYDYNGVLNRVNPYTGGGTFYPITGVLYGTDKVICIYINATGMLAYSDIIFHYVADAEL